MAKIENDKYYTPKELAKKLIIRTFLKIGVSNVTETIEPSAGNGSFSSQIKNCIAYDIEPENDNIIKADFLKTNLEYKQGRLVIGNPPFGKASILLRKFYKHSVKISDYIAFILPISHYQYNYSLYEFDLIDSLDLGLIKYSSRKLHCCFNIYKRPENGQLNKQKKYRFNDISLRVSKRGKFVPEKYDFTICSWGGNIGKICKENQYAEQIYITINNNLLKDKIYNIILNTDYKKEFKAISSNNLTCSRLYKYLLKHIPDLK